MSLAVRRATAQDFVDYYGQGAIYSASAWVGDLDGDLISIGGMAITGGRAFAFFDAKRDLHAHKIALHKTALVVLKEAGRWGYRRVYAAQSEQYPRAGAWLKRLGFRPMDDDGAVLVWQDF